MKPILFVDRMSQPSRAVIIFCRACGIEHEERAVKIAKKEHQTPEYLAVNPLGKLPGLKDGDFCLPESAAILRYLATTRSVPSHWYPVDPQQRARVDAALDWQHANIRAGAARLTYHTVLTRNLGGPFPSDAVLAKQARNTLQAALQALEKVWLAQTSYVAGDQISIADLLIACELEQLVMLGAAAAEVPRIDALLQPFPGVRSWRQRVADETAPHYNEVSAILHSVAKKMGAAVASKL